MFYYIVKCWGRTPRITSLLTFWNLSLCKASLLKTLRPFIFTCRQGARETLQVLLPLLLAQRPVFASHTFFRFSSFLSSFTILSCDTCIWYGKNTREVEFLTQMPYRCISLEESLLIRIPGADRYFVYVCDYENI